jgi:enoyl-CoA hydratase
VNEVVAPEALLERARTVLKLILANGPRAVAASLAAIDQGLDLPLAQALELEARTFGELCGTEEMREGTSAFLAKREPQFKR